MLIYCSGIGGIGLSAYAALQRANGHTVRGSDHADSIVLEDLRELGVAVTLTQDGSFLLPETDLFVYSETIPPFSPQRHPPTPKTPPSPPKKKTPSPAPAAKPPTTNSSAKCPSSNTGNYSCFTGRTLRS